MELLIFLLFQNFTYSAQDSVLKHEFFAPFSQCKSKKKVIYLKPKEHKRIKNNLNFNRLSKIQMSYTFNCKGKTTHVYLLSDLIRTHHQKLFVSIEKSTIKHIEVVHFGEPEKYKAPLNFLSSFLGRSQFKNVDALTGATLTRNSLLRLSKLALELNTR